MARLSVQQLSVFRLADALCLRCAQGGLPSGVSADEFSYAPPEITPGTLRLNGGQPTSLVIGNNSLGDLIFFRGKNFPK